MRLILVGLAVLSIGLLAAVPAIILAALLCGCGDEKATGSLEENFSSGPIERVIQDYVDAYNDRDWQRLESLLATCLLDEGETMTAFREARAQMGRMRTIEIADVVMEERRASASWRFERELGTDDEKEQGALLYFVRESGEWKLALDDEECEPVPTGYAVEVEVEGETSGSGAAIMPKAGIYMVGLEDTMAIPIEIANSDHVAAFSISVSGYSPCFGHVTIQETPLLGSSGREPRCYQDSGDYQLMCVTLGSPVSQGGPPGISGSGTLATMILEPGSMGECHMGLTAQLVRDDVDAAGNPIQIPVVVHGAKITTSASYGD